jgi:hypothetical protein
MGDFLCILFFLFFFFLFIVFFFIIINIVSFILFLVFYTRIAFFVLFCYNCVCEGVFNFSQTAKLFEWHWHILFQWNDWSTCICNFAGWVYILICLLLVVVINRGWGSSWSWSYGSWIYNYLWNQYLKLWVRIPLRRSVLDTTLCDYVSDLRHVGGLLRVV